MLLLKFLFPDDSPLFDVVAFVDFSMPEVIDKLLLVLLDGPKIGRNLVQEECAIAVIPVRHELLLVFVLKVLELEVGNSASCKV